MMGAFSGPHLQPHVQRGPSMQSTGDTVSLGILGDGCGGEEGAKNLLLFDPYLHVKIELMTLCVFIRY